MYFIGLKGHLFVPLRRFSTFRNCLHNSNETLPERAYAKPKQSLQCFIWCKIFKPTNTTHSRMIYEEYRNRENLPSSLHRAYGSAGNGAKTFSKRQNICISSSFAMILTLYLYYVTVEISIFFYRGNGCIPGRKKISEIFLEKT